MKSATFVACFVLALLSAVPRLQAQTREIPHEITVDVPFDFMVKQTMFPAGDYTVRLMGDRTFSLRANHGRESVSLVAEPVHTTTPPSTARLIFTQEGKHFRLRQLWVNTATGGEVPSSPLQPLHSDGRSRVEVLASCRTCK